MKQSREARQPGGLGSILVCACILLSAPAAFGQGAGAAAASISSAPAVPAAPAAPTESSVNNGDNAWVLMGTAMVFLMTAPGLALFYGGLVRKKNVLSVLMQCMVIMCLISVQWVLFGYSLAFGPDHGGVIGGLDWAGLQGVSAAVPHWDAGAAVSYAGTIPHQTFMIFQMMFAVITPGLIIGAFAERMRFGPFCIFTLLWASLVYDPVAHWVWGVGGWLGLMNPASAGKGAYDFAGGTVVHINAGVAALACALFLGKRRGYPDKMSPPHNLPFAVIGAGLLWFGWFGFNAASALGAGKLATSAFVMTHLGAATAGLTWAFMDWVCNKRPTLLGVITGAVGGLVAITPASGFVGVAGAVGIGVGVSLICWTFVSVVKVKLGYDDALDAFGVHGVGGIWGAIATGLFATGGNAINDAMTDGGLFYGPNGLAQLLRQCKAVGVTVVYSFVLTMALLWAVNLLFKLRASESEETIGLDLTQHRETAYTLIH